MSPPAGLSRLVAAAVLAAALTGGGCAGRYEESATEDLRLPGLPRLNIRLDEGSVRITERIGSRIEMQIRRTAAAPSAETARSLLDAVVVEAAEDGEAVEIRGRRTGGFAWRASEELRLSLDVSVPPGTTLEVRTGAGRIVLAGLTGPVLAVSMDGRITAEGLRSPDSEDTAPIHLRTAAGRIEGEDIEGRIHAETGEGSIRLTGRLVEVTAWTGDGAVEVETLPGNSVTDGDWRLRSADGRVSLRLAEGTDAEVFVFGRRLSAEESEALGWTELGPTATATVGSGQGARIRVDAEDGARIRLQRAP